VIDGPLAEGQVLLADQLAVVPAQLVASLRVRLDGARRVVLEDEELIRTQVGQRVGDLRHQLMPGRLDEPGDRRGFWLVGVATGTGGLGGDDSGGIGSPGLTVLRRAHDRFPVGHGCLLSLRRSHGGGQP
jgi:hypothetical protein